MCRALTPDRAALLLCAASFQMRHIAAYLLLVLGGNASPSAADVSGLLQRAGVTADEADLEKLVTALQGKVR